MTQKRRRTKPVTRPSMHDKRMKLNPREDRVVFCDCCVLMTTTSTGLLALKSAFGYKHLNRRELVASARCGCPFCFWVHYRLHHLWNYNSTGRIYMFATGSLRSGINTYGFERITAKVCFGEASIPNICFKVSHKPQIFETEQALRKFLEGAQTRSTNMESPDAIQRARKLLEICQKEHTYCLNQSHSVLPTRVLDVGLAGDPFTKLHISQTGERGLYLALSYCWGGPQHFTTTQTTLMENCQSILLEKLPHTIKNAISLTRQLGFKYLWIDALCILQDSEMDKYKEISHMGEVYKNATITIVASNALSVNEGFLRNIPASRSFWLPVWLQNESFASYPVSFASVMDSSQPGKRYAIHEKQLEPLDRRGWALQEFLLSPRMLAYGGKEVIWRCQSDAITKFPNGIKPSQPLPPSIFQSDALELTRADSKDKQIAIWQSIIEDYSGRELNCAGDRMPAISGIASELARVWKDDYLAGMWRKTLVHNLAWRISEDQVNNAPNETLAGPTWSWISRTSRISFLRMVDIEAKADCNVQVLNTNSPFSDVTSGRLKVFTRSTCMSVLPRILENTYRSSNLYFDDGSSFSFGGASNIKGIDTFHMLLLGGSGSTAIGLIVDHVGEGKYRRRGIWACTSGISERLFLAPLLPRARFDFKYFTIV